VSPSAADLERVFREQLRAVAHALSSLGAEYMLIGGLAVGVWTEVRATKDADLSVRVLADPASSSASPRAPSTSSAPRSCAAASSRVTTALSRASW
jgi:hypothetical protein